MDHLIKPSDYAREMGISRQAVYAKIKKGILTARSVDGKLYIVNEPRESAETASGTRNVSEPSSHTDPSPSSATTPNPAPSMFEPGRELLDAKNETISVLRETVADLKETNRMITSTLRSEVELLKEAFSEMKLLYSAQIEQLRILEQPSELTEKEDVSPEESAVYGGLSEEMQHATTDDLAWIELDDFFDEYGIRKKNKREKIVKRLKKMFKKGDKRVDRFDGELILLAGADFSDLLSRKG